MIGDLVKAKTLKDFYECTCLVHSKCLEERPTGPEPKFLYKFEKKVLLLHLIDGTSTQIFFEHDVKEDELENARLARLENNKSGLE